MYTADVVPQKEPTSFVGKVCYTLLRLGKLAFTDFETQIP
jgi:hypothetical protein